METYRYMANIVSENCLFQDEIKKNCCQKYCFGLWTTDRAATTQMTIPWRCSGHSRAK